jgi:hypothetical protein
VRLVTGDDDGMYVTIHIIHIRQFPPPMRSLESDTKKTDTFSRGMSLSVFGRALHADDGQVNEHKPA